MTYAEETPSILEAVEMLGREKAIFNNDEQNVLWSGTDEQSVNPVVELEDDKEDDMEIPGTQWSEVDGKIISANNTFPRLERGYYSMGCNQTMGLYFEKRSIQTNKLYRLPNEASDLILNDISKFWTLEETYRRYNRVFRRNYLLYSAPGTGKTSLISLMCQELIDKYDGIVFYLNDPEEIMLFPAAMRKIRKIEPDRKVICVIEDIDAMVNGNTSRSTESRLLNILDGSEKVGGVVIIATTNHIEDLEERYVNRPSRFDRVVEFPLPNDASRRMFLERTIMPEDIDKIDLDSWVKRTEGYTIDHLNELVLLFFVFGHSEDESFETIDNMVKRKGVLKNKSSIGKGKEIGF